MAALTAFIKYVRGSAPGCTDKIIKDAVREASIEFCRRSKLIVEVVAVDTVIGQTALPVAPTTGVFSELQKCANADGGHLEWKSLREFYEYEADADTPARFAFLGGSLLLHPTPIAVAVLTVTGVVIPDETDTTVPDELLTYHRKTIAYGAKAIIHSEYEDFMDIKKAVFNQDLFDVGVFRGSIKRATGGTDKPLRSRSRYM